MQSMVKKTQLYALSKQSNSSEEISSSSIINLPSYFLSQHIYTLPNVFMDSGFYLSEKQSNITDKQVQSKLLGTQLLWKLVFILPL